MYATSETESVAAIEGLFAGDFPVENVPVAVLSGTAAFAAFTVLGKVTASGKYIPSVETAVDGSENPVAIAVYPVDASGSDVVAQAYVAGSFNMDKLVWDASYDTDAKKLDPFVGGPLFVKKTGPSV